MKYPDGQTSQQQTTQPHQKQQQATQQSRQPAQQLERTPTDRHFIEVSDPWATHNKQAGTAREKLGQMKQQQGQQQTQPAPGSARAKLAQIQQKQGIER